jgi:hypothetical protein
MEKLADDAIIKRKSIPQIVIERDRDILSSIFYDIRCEVRDRCERPNKIGPVVSPAVKRRN